MQWLARGLVLVIGAVTLLSVTGCDVTQQVLDTIGLAGNIAGVWLK